MQSQQAYKFPRQNVLGRILSDLHILSISLNLFPMTEENPDQEELLDSIKQAIKSARQKTALEGKKDGNS